MLEDSECNNPYVLSPEYQPARPTNCSGATCARSRPNRHDKLGARALGITIRAGEGQSRSAAGQGCRDKSRFYHNADTNNEYTIEFYIIILPDILQSFFYHHARAKLLELLQYIHVPVQRIFPSGSVFHPAQKRFRAVSSCYKSRPDYYRNDTAGRHGVARRRWGGSPAPGSHPSPASRERASYSPVSRHPSSSQGFSPSTL